MKPLKQAIQSVNGLSKMDEINLTIDGTDVRVKKGATVLIGASGLTGGES